MRKTKAISIGLLATSLAACHHHPVHHHTLINSWGDDYYIDDGYGYAPAVYWYPTAIYYNYGYYNGHICNRTSVIYRNTSGYHATSGGRVSRSYSSHGSYGRSGTPRGGFGSSGHSASS